MQIESHHHNYTELQANNICKVVSQNRTKRTSSVTYKNESTLLAMRNFEKTAPDSPLATNKTATRKTATIANISLRVMTSTSFYVRPPPSSSSSSYTTDNAVVVKEKLAKLGETLRELESIQYRQTGAMLTLNRERDPSIGRYVQKLPGFTVPGNPTPESFPRTHLKRANDRLPRDIRDRAPLVFDDLLTEQSLQNAFALQEVTVNDQLLSVREEN